MKKIFLVSMLFCALSLSACEANMPSGTSADAPRAIDVLLDASQFAGISEETLIEKMGEPESREEWNYNDGIMVYPMVSCVYENNRFEFLLNNDQVLRISVYADSYNSLDGEPFTFVEKEDVLKMFAVDPKDAKYAKKTDTNSALRYEDFGNIRSLWVPSYEDNSFDEVKIDFSDLFN